MQITKGAGWKWSAKRIAWIIAVLGLALAFWLSLPSPLFDDPCATVVFDREGRLLGARIASDGQWRFPMEDSVPAKYRACLLSFEDRHFYRHPGVNPGALFRALWQNLRAGKVVSGGSTVTMQVIRLARKGKPRTVFEKVVEMWLALRLEAAYSKSTILRLYASHAPYGGNVVGLGAAAWRYFGRPPGELSWAEAATLAVLPNAPSAMHPGKNREQLMRKRNRLLENLHEKGMLDRITFELACEEPLPVEPLPLPQPARHLVDRLHRLKAGERYYTTIDGDMQERVGRIAGDHSRMLAANQIHNSAVLVVDLNTCHVLAYLGNSAPRDETDHSPDVDIILSPRSTGSILKPFLYAAMMDAGELLPGMLVPDIPSFFSGFSPKNFSQTYDGAVPASQALSRSLNVPAVYLLRQYGVQPFYDFLENAGMTTLSRPASHYGLSLILGGAEGTLWDICAMYMNLGRTPVVYADNYGDYDGVQAGSPQLVDAGMESRSGNTPLYSAGAAWLTLAAMSDVNRPGEEEGWRSFASSREIAWKTGTSFGFRDAWAIGLTPSYLVGVWVGNADGEGRPGLTGVSAASPLMFQVFRLLPDDSHWFPEPYDELEKIEVCRQSGHRASLICPVTDSVMICRAGLRSGPCPYHRQVHLDETETYRVNDGCYPAASIRARPWFVLPPAWAWYYRLHEPLYRPLPGWLPGCQDNGPGPMQFIYPSGDKTLFIPVGLDGKPGEVVFEAAHQVPGTTIYWHLDNEYAGSTRDLHKLSIRPPPGRHKLTLVDQNGDRVEIEVEVAWRE